MTECIQTSFEFPSVKKRKLQCEFSGGDITSDGGILLLRQADRLTGLMRAANAAIADPRDPNRVLHDQLSLLRQRVFALACGYEDLNDHQDLRNDPAIQTAVERDERLASASTLCRLEQRMGRTAAVALHEVLIDRFIASYKQPPKELILDFDATDDPVHGTQEGRFFHGYYDHYCFLPLYVFCGDQLLVSYLRPSKIDGAKHAWAILALLVKRLRQTWPKVRIIFRGDSGFCRWRMLAWCERHDVGYIVGIAKNSRLEAKVAQDMQDAAACYQETRHKVRWFKTLYYSARSWDRPRCIIAKIEHLDKGPNPRFVVTNLPGLAKRLYEKVYCGRGEMEN
ncbi:MAG: IS1380 family transposase, partial [Candidatus Thiodiazotropha endolucinida]|nr:IS1380 family transposase [Candidatus Thiodiazotropha endolucinida]